MKKKIILLLTCCYLSLTLLTGASASPSLSCQASCVLEMDTGRILYTQEADVELPMASTTKIMTALLVIEAGDLDTVVSIPEQAVGVEGSSLYLKEGERFTRKSLLYGLMLASGNDVAVALAIDLAGSVNEFVTMMNEKAVQIGAENTRFANPHGLPADEHYTTAYDLALIASVAMRNQTFCEIVGTKSIVIEPQGEGVRRTLQNKNKLLWQFDGAMGIKTGYTKSAGRCLVAAADREGKRVVAVVLNAPDMWDDISVLMENTLNSLSQVVLIQAGELLGTVCIQRGIEKQVCGVLACDFTACITQEERGQIEYKITLPDVIEAPVVQGEVVGCIEAYLDGICINKADIVSANHVARETYFHCLKQLMNLWIGISP